MLKYRFLYLFTIISICSTAAFSQDGLADEESEAENIEEVQKLSVGFAFDYLKLHTLITDQSEKWEGAVNIRVIEKISAIGEFGIAQLTPDDAYKNSQYSSEGSYYRLGLDYHFTVKPGNFLFLGLRYSKASFDEKIYYEIGNPLFASETGELIRNDLNANWIELVLTSEKEVKRIRNYDIPDFLSLGFKLRLKSLQDFDSFSPFEVKNIPGYGRTNIQLNPELNLYIKFRIPIF